MSAKKLEEIYSNFKLEPLNLSNYDEYFVLTDNARGIPAIERIKRRLEQEPDTNLKILFAGYRGCGKSTELVRLQRDIDKDFIIISFSVLSDLDILNLNYIELFIVAMERLFNFLNEHNEIEISNDYLEIIKNWTKSIETEEIRINESSTDAEAGTEVGVIIPGLLKFFSKLKASTKASTTFKDTLKNKIEPRLSEFIQNCNLLINEIKGKMSTINKKGIIIIFEDLDKVPLKLAENIFYEHYSQLNSLSCHCIFTYPIALVYHNKFNIIRNYYGECFTLPMIRVINKDGSTNKEGEKSVIEILENRMDLSLYENRETYIKMIEKSGGCLRDLFRMITNAADNALDSGRQKINSDDYGKAYNYLISDYRRTIADSDETEIKASDYYDELAKLAKDPTKKVDSTKAMLDLRHNLSVLQYNNDDEWCDVHPAVKDILKEKKMIGL